MAKRSGNGTVAAVLGPQYAATDIATRSGIDPASIRRQLDALPADDRAMFDGYAQGVNARIQEVLANKAQLCHASSWTRVSSPAPGVRRMWP
jgi:penicillin amidase